VVPTSSSLVARASIRPVTVSPPTAAPGPQDVQMVHQLTIKTAKIIARSTCRASVPFFQRALKKQCLRHVKPASYPFWQLTPI
jgi:hypothetical protein